MKKIKKVLLYAVIFIVLAIVTVISYVTLALPDVGKPENITVALTPQRIARGQYLANHVCLCIDCHSQRDWSKPIGDIPPGILVPEATILIYQKVYLVIFIYLILRLIN